MRGKSDILMKPAVILVGPQLGENIGTVARAMLNFGLEDLRLVNPRHGWDVDRAIKASAGADKVVENRKTFTTTAEAIADLGYIVATTARSRDMVKTVLTPEKTAEKIYSHASEGVKSGLMFGPERTGLGNDEISLCDAICTVPLNPDFSSLNLAQAVLLMSYVWSNYKDDTAAEVLLMTDTRPANRGELSGMFTHLENALDEAGFLAPPEKKPAMARNIRNMLMRTKMTEQDVRTFRGMINSLLRWPRGAKDSEMKARVLAISRGDPDPGDQK